MDAYIPKEVKDAAQQQGATVPPAFSWIEATDAEKLRYMVSAGLMSHVEEQRLRQEYEQATRDHRTAGIVFAIIAVAAFVSVALWG